MNTKMKSISNLSKLTIIICTVTVLLAVIIVCTANSMQETSQNVYEHPYTSSNSARGMRSRLIDMKRFVNVFLTHDFNGVQNTRALFQERYEMQTEAIEILYERYSGPKEDVDALRSAMDNLIAWQDKAIDYAVGHSEDEILNYITLYVYPQYDIVNNCLTTIIDFADQKICALTETSRRTAILSVTVTLLLSTGIVFLCIYSNRREQKNIRQLTDRERELRDALILAQKANNVKRDFLSCMSHEMRTPLNVIIGMAAIAGAHLEDRNRVEGCLAKVALSSQHLLSIINDVLDMSKIEDNKLSISHEPFQLQQLMESLVSTVYSQTAERKVLFKCNIKGITAETYIGDYMRVNQILLNLLSNAIKFTPIGGQIRLEVKSSSMQEGKASLSFTVSDTGIGMSEDFLDRIFMPFEQADSSISRKYGGTGLGMAITHNLVELLGGTITVESKLGQGTTFVVELPFDVPEEENHPKWELSALKFLVVDDDEEIFNHTNLLLKGMGINAQWAKDGCTAVDMVLRAHEVSADYQVCLVDWEIPNMDGLEVTRRIREKIGPETLIIIISAYDWNMIEDEARSAGADAFISKPLFESSLYNTLLSVVNPALIQKAGQPIQPTQPNFAGKRFLLAEDNMLNREIAEELLQMAGAEIDSTENGKEAVDKFLSSPAGYYSVILMDIQMPVMDGYEATKHMRASSHPDAKRVPIIAMTANAFKEDAEKALASGMNAHLTKPINIEIFYQTLVEATE